MFLKKLEINGFKSFAAKTVLDFSTSPKDGGAQGITAIVGPNGSGKSNIADAMRWVIGEQSMKNLRSKKSEDIIFAGSGKKAKLGSAQVTLYFDNSEKRLPLDFSEVAICRKIFRSGESEYLVNGSRVRLQDIVDILAKAGVGKESYAIINQGMADSILSATPLERRFVIEEAAGVKQYQIKKERSLRKLETTKANLVRASELIEEIRPHLRVLKRQAEKAAQSEIVAKDLKEKQTKLYTYLWNKFNEDKLKLNEEKDTLGAKMNNIQREADKLMDEVNRRSKEEKTNETLQELEKSQREKRTRLNDLERELIISEGRIELEKEKQKSIQIIEEIKIQSQPVDLSYVKGNLEEIRRDQEILVQKLNVAKDLKDIEAVRELARRIQQKLTELRGDIENGHAYRQAGKKETSMPAKKVEAKPIEVVVQADSQAIIDLRAKSFQVRAEIRTLEEDLQKIAKEIQAEIALDREKRQQFFQVERELRLKQDETNSFKDKYNDFKISLAKIEVREEDLRARILEELKMEAELLDKKLETVDQFSLEREIAKLKFQMEQIGGIDPLVLTEYNETEKRFQFLTTESADLENALVSLREVIKEMEKKVNEKFHETFDEINKEFSKYFRIIFGGGDAHLTKVKIKTRRTKDEILESEATEQGNETEEGELNPPADGEDDKDEIGIDISACPAGKKIASLAMLSGGERSLTSLALLFAIIAHNPPPFSILDEVEAALDEANSKRFGRIIQDLSDSTQFVIITHNRETMRQASLLYGVTMGEDGMSKLLSVKIDQVGKGGKIIR
ncbi:MAG: AAA family ATPase [Candidatus Moranbacteria bacterium]|nr:AAA family ATPase [Candidatus Moranbacteria bacterium]